MPLSNRLCPICGNSFTPNQWKQRHCSSRDTGRNCVNISKSLRMRGLIPKAALHGRARYQRERSRDAVRSEFGVISDRDADLIRRALKIGWQRGYDACRRYFKRCGVAAA